MGLKVHGFAVSATTATVLLTLYEKQVTDFELVVVNFINGDQHKPQHLAKQPFGKIPCLEDEDLTLFESRAIARYVADKYAGQGTDLYPQNLKDRAAVDQWLEVEGQCWKPPVMNIALELFYAPMIFGRESDQAVVAANMEQAGRVLDVLEDRLSKSKYLAGDFFSLADLVFIPPLYLMARELSEIVSGRKHMQAWWENVTARSSWKKHEAELAHILPLLQSKQKIGNSSIQTSF